MRLVLYGILLLTAAELLTLLTSIFLHRELSHHSLTVRPSLGNVIRILFWLYPGVSGVEWAAVHNHHHRFADEPGDPHSPALYGRRRIVFLAPWLYRRALREIAIATPISAGNISRLDRFIIKHRWLGRAVGTGLLMVAFGPLIGFAFYILLAALYTVLIGLTNAFAHPLDAAATPHIHSRIGRRTLAVVTAGEGSAEHHALHHRNPGIADFRVSSSEFDGAWVLVCILRNLSLLQVAGCR